MGKYLTGWPAIPSPKGGAPSPYSPCPQPPTTKAEAAADDTSGTSAVPAPSLPYDLLAVVNHSGSMAQGHYTAFVKEVGRWFRFDDTWVREVDEEEVLASEAYILFYFQRGADAAWRPSPASSVESPPPSRGAAPSPASVVGKRRL